MRKNNNRQEEENFLLRREIALSFASPKKKNSFLLSKTMNGERVLFGTLLQFTPNCQKLRRS